MFWIVIAIIAAGWIIAAAIKSSMREANMTPEQRAAIYEVQESIEKEKNVKELCNTIYLLSRQGKSNRQIAGNSNVQKYARVSGIDIKNEDMIRDIKRDPNFLIAIDCFDKFKAMVASGESDKKIANKLYRQRDIFASSCYKPEDIAFMRKNI